VIGVGRICCYGCFQLNQYLNNLNQYLNNLSMPRIPMSLVVAAHLSLSAFSLPPDALSLLDYPWLSLSARTTACSPQLPTSHSAAGGQTCPDVGSSQGALRYILSGQGVFRSLDPNRYVQWDFGVGQLWPSQKQGQLPDEAATAFWQLHSEQESVVVAE
jgi:hypothetical protein